MKTASIMTALLFLLSLPILAQEPAKLHFVVHGGVATPEGPNEFADGWKDSSGFGGGVGYRISPRLSVLGLVNYDRFAINGEKLLADFGLDALPVGVDLRISGAETTILCASAELKAALRKDAGKVSPYVTIGAGVADVEVSDATVSASLLGLELHETVQGMSETVAMATTGAGIDVPLGKRVGAFLEGRYQTAFTQGESTDIVGFRAGIRLSR